jgi:hypothetical protein
MLGLCEKLALLPSKKPDDEFEDALLEVTATFPMKTLEPGITYKGLPFDAQEFLKQVEQAKGALPQHHPNRRGNRLNKFLESWVPFVEIELGRF